MIRWRCEVRGNTCDDKGLIARYFRAATAQDAMAQFKATYGHRAECSVTKDTCQI